MDENGDHQRVANGCPGGFLKSAIGREQTRIRPASRIIWIMCVRTVRRRGWP